MGLRWYLNEFCCLDIFLCVYCSPCYHTPTLPEQSAEERVARAKMGLPPPLNDFEIYRLTTTRRALGLKPRGPDHPELLHPENQRKALREMYDAQARGLPYRYGAGQENHEGSQGGHGDQGAVEGYTSPMGHGMHYQHEGWQHNHHAGHT
ncbi:MAG: hypothetical protein Q9220_001149 [cf. Caloplaca sp. 1 TL-2023]